MLSDAPRAEPRALRQLPAALRAEHGEPLLMRCCSTHERKAADCKRRRFRAVTKPSRLPHIVQVDMYFHHDDTIRVDDLEPAISRRAPRAGAVAAAFIIVISVL